MVRRFVVGFLFLSILSCTDYPDKVVVELQNDSAESLRNIKITTTEELNSISFTELPKGDVKNTELQVEKNRADGQYVLEFDKSGAHYKYLSGYYSNGFFFEKKIKWIVKNDTIIFKTNEF